MGFLSGERGTATGLIFLINNGGVGGRVLNRHRISPFLFSLECIDL